MGQKTKITLLDFIHRVNIRFYCFLFLFVSQGCSSYFIDDDGFVVASNKEDGTEV